MQPGALVAGRYRVENVIGRGGMGYVVEATHLALGTKVAIKFLDPALASDPTVHARFQLEAKATATLKSDHICRVLDFGVDERTPYIVMELLEGSDLANLIKLRPLEPAVAADYVIQACRGLAEAHAEQIVHRDLKPGNLFLARRSDGSSIIKILDFGVAKALAGPAGLTRTAHVVGSTGFMSPEQFRSSRNVDQRSDIWSLGVILYRLVSKRLPYKADSVAEFALGITRDPMPPLPESPELEPICRRCLEKKPENRYPDVLELTAALRAIVSAPPPKRPTPNPIPMAPPAAPIKGTLLGAAAPVAAAPAFKGPPGELAPGTKVGEYVIERKIGQGGMGAVYAAIHPLISKKAAIKVINAELGTDPEIVARFVQEARSVNQIGHPNIVDVFAFGQLPDGRSYFVMEFLQGESLRDVVSRPSIALGESLQILDEIAAALEAAHENGIVHRDLKPDNVFLAQARPGFVIVKLLDFGIAKLAVPDPTSSGSGIMKTKTGMMIGTPTYLSPEQARGKNVDYRTDIYALGCITFEMVCGRLPFIAQSAMDIVLKHISEPPPVPSSLRAGIPPALDALILQMLEKDPNQRPSLADLRSVFTALVASGEVVIEHGSGITIRSDLRARRGAETPSKVRAHTPSEAPTGTAPTAVGRAPAAGTAHALPAAPKKKRRRLAIALGAVVTGAIAGGVAFFAVQSDESGAAGTGTGSGSAVIAAAGSAHAADAGVFAEAPKDAAVVAATPVDAKGPTTEIHVNCPTARIEVDGVIVQTEGSGASIPLEPGSHHVVVTATGKRTFDKTLALTETPLEVRLDPIKKGGPTGGGSKPPKPTEPQKPPDPKKPHDVNYTVDPFAQ
jgi:serine/threonine-protein kinase